MKNKKINLAQVCKEFEDVLAPRLGMPLIDRVVYYHLLRHSRVEGKVRLHFSVMWLAHNIGITGRPVRDSVRRLVQQGVLRLLERSNLGHLVEVRLPSEVPMARPDRTRRRGSRHGGQAGEAGVLCGPGLDEVDFMQTRALRQAIHARERGRCFYCLRRIPRRIHCLDHVVPRAGFGSNSYRNLVSCCLECNWRKGERSAGDYVRWLRSEGRLTGGELLGRLRALRALAAGRFRPLYGLEDGGEVRGGRVVERRSTPRRRAL
jgi:hypothetical protein